MRAAPLRPASPRLAPLLPAPLLMAAPALLTFGVFFAVPLAMTGVLSVYAFVTSGAFGPDLTAANYGEVLLDPYYREVFLRTYLVALATTAISVAIGTPEAYVIHRMGARWRGLLLLVVIGPLLVSAVIRTFGWMVILGNSGLVNRALLGAGLVDRPVGMMFTSGAVVLGLVHVLTPFLVLSVWASLARLDPAIEQAAVSLGASRWVVFFRVVLPNVAPGVLSGSLIVFCMAASAFATPLMLGGKRIPVVSGSIYTEFLSTLNWPLGAALAVVLLLVNLLLVLAYNGFVERRYLARLG